MDKKASKKQQNFQFKYSLKFVAKNNGKGTHI